MPTPLVVNAGQTQQLQPGQTFLAPSAFPRVISANVAVAASYAAIVPGRKLTIAAGVTLAIGSGGILKIDP
jgi:hypothetical protein